MWSAVVTMTKIGAQVFTVILVTILFFNSGKCHSQPKDVSESNNYKLRGSYYNFRSQPVNKWHVTKPPPSLHHNYALPPQRLRHRERLEGYFKRLQNSRNTLFNAPHKHHHHLQRLIRQAYPGYKPTLYPSLPTPSPSYHNQGYPNHNYIQQNHTSYSPPYNPQWQNNMPNYSQSGYPGSIPNGNGFNNLRDPSGYNPNYPPYNARPSAPVSPNPTENQHFAQGHGYQYPYTTPINFNSFGRQNSPGHQPYPGSSSNNNRPGYSPSHGNRNHSFTYNPSQRPPYLSQNNSVNPHKPNYPSYSTTQRYPSPYNTTQGTPYKYPNQVGPYNNSLPSTSYTQPISSNGSHGPYNPGQNYPNPNFPGFPSTNPTSGYPNTHNNQYPSHNTNFNYTNSFNRNTGQGYYPYGYNLTAMNSMPATGSNGQNNYAYPYNPNQGSYNSQQNNLSPNNGYFPQPQYNGTSTYRIANHYNPSIPNQPPRRDNYGPNSPFYPSNTTFDPTRVSPARFSY